MIARNTEKEGKIVDTQLCESLRDCEASRRHRFNARISSVAQDSEISRDGTVISLTNALIHPDIPVDTARLYNDLVAHGEHLIMVEANTADLLGAEKILNGCGVRE